MAEVRFVYHEYDYRPNWTTRSPITITNCKFLVLSGGIRDSFDLAICILARLQTGTSSLFESRL